MDHDAHDRLAQSPRGSMAAAQERPVVGTRHGAFTGLAYTIITRYRHKNVLQAYN